MDAMISLALLFGFATLRYLPAVVLPGLSPLSWAPMLVRVTTMLALAWITVLTLPASVPLPTPEKPLGLVLAACGELLIGGVFGLAFLLPNAGLHTSGWLLDMQAGLGAATLLNPASGDSQESLLGHALMLGATALFFTLDLHVVLFKALVTTSTIIPPGRMAHSLSATGFMQLLGASFMGGLLVVVPVLVGLLMVDVAVAFASRSMPQANVYFLALPLKVAAAMGFLALTLSWAPALVERLFRSALVQAPAMLGTP